MSKAFFFKSRMEVIVDTAQNVRQRGEENERLGLPAGIAYIIVDFQSYSV